MAKVVKSCDYTGYVAMMVFSLLNKEQVKLKLLFGEYHLVTDTEPKDLIYPEGWYYAKGKFRNKHNSTTGAYYEIPMQKSDGQSWLTLAKYSTSE